LFACDNVTQCYYDTVTQMCYLYVAVFSSECNVYLKTADELKNKLQSKLITIAYYCIADKKTCI